MLTVDQAITELIKQSSVIVDIETEPVSECSAIFKNVVSDKSS